MLFAMKSYGKYLTSPSGGKVISMLRWSRPRVNTFKTGLAVLVLVAVYLCFSNLADSDNKTVTLDETNTMDAKQSVKNAIEKTKLDQEESSQANTQTKRLLRWKESIHIAVVSCGDRMEESLVMLKSALLFSRSALVFHVFTEPETMKSFQEQLDYWSQQFQDMIDYKIYSIQFPESEHFKSTDWKKVFRPCATQRLFLPSLLTDVDSLLYVDTDTLFLSPVEEMWKLFKLFNSTQLVALALDGEDRVTGYYNRFAKHPYYGEIGLNSGVMLMNLTRLRSSPWLTSMHNYIKEYKQKIRFGDQDLINIYFHYYLEQVYIFQCDMNYRTNHCTCTNLCKAAEKSGAHILHGSRRVWYDFKQPAFQAVFTAFKEHRLGASIKFELLLNLKSLLKKAPESNCGKIPGVFTKQIEEYINSYIK